MSDRGYRDEIGAAVERLEALAEENARLRAELDRLDAPKREAARRRSTRVVMLLLGVVFGMSFTAIASHRYSPPNHRHHRHAFRAQHTSRSLDVRPRVHEHELAPIRYGDDCSIPFYYDRNNVRHWKPSCLVDSVE